MSRLDEHGLETLVKGSHKLTKTEVLKERGIK